MLLVKVVSQYWFVTLIAIQKNFTIISSRLLCMPERSTQYRS